MSQPENTFISSIHKKLPLKIYRMKNHNAYHGGIADVWYSWHKDLWVEYKFVPMPKRDATVIDLTAGKDPIISALQQRWLHSRHDEGRNVAVIVGCKEGGIWLPGISWADRFTAKEFLCQLNDRAQLASKIEEALT